MKYYIYIFCLVITALSYSQWQADVRLTNDPNSSQTHYGQRCITASGDTLHVVWDDNRVGNYEIYYKRSTNSGSTWGNDVRLTNNPGLSIFPVISSAGAIVLIVWHENRDGNFQVYYKRSNDAGLNWGSDIRLSNTFAWSYIPSIDLSGSQVCVVWEDSRDTLYEIYYKLSSDNGLTWGLDTRLTHSSSIAQYPEISISGQSLHIVWQDHRDGNDEIYYIRSSNFGSNWGNEIRLTNNDSISGFPNIIASNSIVHIAWHDNRNGNNEIFYKRSTDNGTNWGSDIRLTNNSFISENPSLEISDSIIHVVWDDTRDGNYEIYYKRSTNSGTLWGDDIRLTNNSSYSAFASCTITGLAIHVLWNDSRDGNLEIYYKSNPTGNLVGLEKSTGDDIPEHFSLSQNYPNPFNPSTTIRFSIPMVGNHEHSGRRSVRIIVYDILGKEITTLVNEQLQPGTYSVTWDAANYPSGVYLYKIISGDFTQSKKMVLVK